MFQIINSGEYNYFSNTDSIRQEGHITLIGLIGGIPIPTLQCGHKIA